MLKVMVSALADAMDVQVLLLPLVVEYFERVRASTSLIRTTADADADDEAAAAATETAGFAPSSGFGATGAAAAAVNDPFGFATLLTPTPMDATVASTAAAPAGALPSNAPVKVKRVIYQAVYVDLLIAACEHLVVSMQSAGAFALMQKVWGWLRTFSSLGPEWLPPPAAEGSAAPSIGSKSVSHGNTADLLSTLLSDDTSPAEAPAGLTGMQPLQCQKHANGTLLASISRLAVVAVRQQSLHADVLPNAVGISSRSSACAVSRIFHDATDAFLLAALQLPPRLDIMLLRCCF